MLVRVHVRRFSAAVPAAQNAATESGPLARLTGFFKPQPIEDIVEMKTLQTVQQIAEQVSKNPMPSRLVGGGSTSIREWLRQYQQSKQLTVVDKDGFQELMKDIATHISTTEALILSDVPPISSSLTDGEDKSVHDAYVELLQLKLLSQKCNQVSGHFDLVDEDKDGSVSLREIELLVQKVFEGSNDDWVRYQFELADTDSDELVTEAESKQILDSIILLQKAVLADLFATRVANLPKKKPMKMFDEAINETNWKEKLPEKVRCVFHFAAKDDDEKKLVHWESFKESQEAELPELHEMLRVYAKGVYNERYTFYERKQEARSRRLKGIALAIALGVGDFLFALV